MKIKPKHYDPVINRMNYELELLLFNMTQLDDTQKDEKIETYNDFVNELDFLMELILTKQM